MPSYTTDFSIVFRYLDVLLKGLKLTVGFTLVSTIGGLLIGLLLGGARLSRRPSLRGPAGVYIEVFRTTPLLVQLIWFYYALPMLIHVNISAPFAGGLALSLYVSSFYAEIFRGGIQSIERGQRDAAKALGMTYIQSMRRIILPQAIKRMIPPFMNQTIIQFKNTSLLSTLAIGDLLYQGTVVSSTTYRPLEVYTTVAVMYIVILYPAALLVGRMEKRLAISE